MLPIADQVPKPYSWCGYLGVRAPGHLTSRRKLYDEVAEKLHKVSWS